MSVYRALLLHCYHTVKKQVLVMIKWWLCADEDASGLKMIVHGIIADVPIPFPLDNPDGCKDSNITCPIKKNQAYGYRNVIFVKTSYPSVRNSSKLSAVFL